MNCSTALRPLAAELGGPTHRDPTVGAELLDDLASQRARALLVLHLAAQLGCEQVLVVPTQLVAQCGLLVSEIDEHR